MAPSFPNHSADSPLRVVSWNLLRRVGAGVEDVAKLVRSHHPDLLLLQECTEDIVTLPSLVGGHFFRHPMQSRIYGLAAWSPHPFPASTELRLPGSILPGRVPPPGMTRARHRGTPKRRASLRGDVRRYLP